jgi:hypothetical protein
VKYFLVYTCKCAADKKLPGFLMLVSMQEIILAERASMFKLCRALVAAFRLAYQQLSDDEMVDGL